MPAMSNPNEINNALWLRTSATKNGIPADCVRPYRILFNQGVGHFKTIINDVIEKNGSLIEMPMQESYLENYLSGYTFEYKTFCNLYEVGRQTEGFWRFSDTDPNHIIIHYNRCATSGRQRHSKIHEMMHFVQTVDPAFLYFMDELILNSTLPEFVVVKLLHRLTDRATSMYLMPNDYFRKKYQEIEQTDGVFGDAQLRKLANAFDVSMQSAKYRIQECV